MDYFLRKSLSKYLTDMIDFNKHVHDIDVFINDKSRTSRCVYKIILLESLILAPKAQALIYWTMYLYYSH
jgi:hypothetical protein